MYERLEERFEAIRYKKCKLIRGEYEETGDEGTLNGYVSFDLSHLSNSGIDISSITASVITNFANAGNIDTGDLLELNHKFVKVVKKLNYRNPFNDTYDTFELLT